MRHSPIALASLLGLAACTTTASPGPADLGALPDGARAADETWSDGKHLIAPVTIAAGEVVAIAPGATVTADPGVTITVAGTLRAATSGQHSTITGTGWGGLIVPTGGVLALDGVDLVGATTALDLRCGSATLSDGSIQGAATPFTMAPSSALTLTHETVVGATTESDLAGTFTASYLAYQKVGRSEGLVVADPLAVVDISDSTFTGTTTGSGDYIVSGAAHTLSVAYTVIDGAHCGFHFSGVDRFTIDHVTSGGAAVSMTGGDTNAWGAMLYGAGAGPHTISNSNFVAIYTDIDLQNDNGALTITNTYTDGKDNLMPSAATTFTWSAADHAAAPIADAHPR